MLPADFNPHQQFTRWLMNKNIDDNDFPKYVLFKHNSHMWQNENPHVVHQTHHQHRFSVNVRAGIIDNNLVKLYLLPTRLTDLYEVVLREVLRELLDDVPLSIRLQMWFQQDDAPAHTSRNVRQFIYHTFTNR